MSQGFWVGTNRMFVLVTAWQMASAGIFDGRAGWYYALQRMSAEALFNAAMLDIELRALEAPASTVLDFHGGS